MHHMKMKPRHNHDSPHAATRSQPWVETGSFNCENGRWRGMPFPMEPDVIMAVTNLMADNDGQAKVVRQVRRDNSDARLIFRLVLPV